MAPSGGVDTASKVNVQCGKMLAMFDRRFSQAFSARVSSPPVSSLMLT